MEALKKVNPFSAGQDTNKQSSGQEPVSGVQGEGSATKPFDAGNQEDEPELSGKAPQHTNAVPPNKEQSGQEPLSGQQGAGTATQPFDSGNLEENPELGGKDPQQTTSGDVTPTATEQTPLSSQSAALSHTSEASEPVQTLVKQPTIGSSRWFTNANPFAKRTLTSEEPTQDSVDPKEEQQYPSTEAASFTPSMSPSNAVVDETVSSQTTVFEPVIDPAFSNTGYLPNHLGDDVPPGQTDVYDRSKGKGKGKAMVVDDIADHRSFTVPTEVSSAASNRSEMMRPDSMTTDYTYPTAGTDASTIASSSRRSSQVLNIPLSKGKPITAGGVPLGFRAMQDRERRFTSMPIYEYPEQDFFAPQPKSYSISTLPNTQKEPEPTPKEPASTTLRGSKKNDLVGVGEQTKKQPFTETSIRRRSVVQKAKSLFGRKGKPSV